MRKRQWPMQCYSRITGSEWVRVRFNVKLMCLGQVSGHAQGHGEIEICINVSVKIRPVFRVRFEVDSFQFHLQ